MAMQAGESEANSKTMTDGETMAGGETMADRGAMMNDDIQKPETQQVSTISCIARTAGYRGKTLRMSMLRDRTVRPLRSAGMIEYKRGRAVGEARRVRARRNTR
mgnify:CR=1 FL=1